MKINTIGVNLINILPKRINSSWAIFFNLNYIKFKYYLKVYGENINFNPG